MIASRQSRGCRKLAAAALFIALAGCTASARPPASSAGHVVTGAFLTDGSCRVLVDGVPLFTPADSARSGHVGAAAVNLAPPGYELDELACAPARALATLPPDRAGDRALIVTIHVARGAAAHAGRYLVRGALGSNGDTTTGIASHAAAAVFGAPPPDAADAAGGVRYLEARDGSVTLTRLDSAHVVGTFTMRAISAWSP